MIIFWWIEKYIYSCEFALKYLLLILLLWENAFSFFLFGIQRIKPERCCWKVQKDKGRSVTIIRMLCCPYLFAHPFKSFLNPHSLPFSLLKSLTITLFAFTQSCRNNVGTKLVISLVYTTDSRLQSMVRFSDKRLGFYGWENLAVTFKTVVKLRKGLIWVVTSHA